MIMMRLHEETICFANQLTSFYIIATLAVNELRLNATIKRWVKMQSVPQKICEICSKLTIQTPERSHVLVFIVNYGQVWNCSSLSINDFEQVYTGWVFINLKRTQNWVIRIAIKWALIENILMGNPVSYPIYGQCHFHLGN